MKNNFLALAAGIASAAILTVNSFAQDVNNQTDVANNQIASATTTPAGLPNSSPLHSSIASKFQLKAMKDFRNRFASAAATSWYPDQKSFLVLFTEDGCKCRALYDRRGSWQYSIKYEDEKKLPHEIRDVVKRTYYDYTITLVQEISTTGHMIYLVHLEDENTLKIVKVSPEGEMEMYQDLVKR